MPETPEESIQKHYRLERILGRQCYLLLCARGPVTIRSQQVRAMNLVWALREQLGKSPNVPVIGGGAAGLTFAAGAARVGANVHLFENGGLMHLQVGGWHRPLHPEIYTWPEDTAWRPVSHLPLLGWTTGTAHDVATEIASKFRTLQQTLQKLGRSLNVHDVRATLTAGGQLKADAAGIPAECSIIVLAVGFGVENTLFDVPFTSYWRADALDQSFLGRHEFRAAVIGSGDGALLDVLRSCVQRTDQGPFLDSILAVTLPDRTLLDQIRKFSSEDFQEGRGYEVEQAYRELGARHEASIAKIDKHLLDNRRRAKVKWLIRDASPFDSSPLPINRFLVSRLLLRPQEYGLEVIRNATVRTAVYKNRAYVVSYTTTTKDANDVRRRSFSCDHLAVRIGPKRLAKAAGEGGQSRGLLQSVARVFEGEKADFLTS